MRDTIAADPRLVVLAVGATTPFESPEPLVQAVGTTTFMLADVTVPATSDLAPGDRLAVEGRAGERATGIDRRLGYHDLTPPVQGVLAQTVERIIQRNERRFIECFNTPCVADRDGDPLALLPGIDPDCRAVIAAERNQRRFAGFDDLMSRVACCEQPWTLLAERVLHELRGGTGIYRWVTA